MFLSSDCKNVLEIIRRSEPDLPNHFYSIYKLFDSTHFSYTDAFAIMDYLERSECIYWGDKQHTAFRLLEKGRNFEEFQKHDRKMYWADKWFDILAIIISVVALIISVA